MIVFPAIDLKAGQVVRLAEGDMARATVYADDPAAQAERFGAAGADWLHVVDLDGAHLTRRQDGPSIAMGWDNRYQSSVPQRGRNLAVQLDGRRVSLQLVEDDLP